MLIGCPREIKPQEFRVGISPAATHEAVAACRAAGAARVDVLVLCRVAFGESRDV